MKPKSFRYDYRNPKEMIADNFVPPLAPARPVRVLVVEDHDDTRFLIKTVLEMHGIGVLEATDGETAIELARSENLDLILMDRSLPRLDGLATARLLREKVNCRNIPIVILSGHAETASQVAALDAGCDAYIVKPFDVEELVQTLNLHLKII